MASGAKKTGNAAEIDRLALAFAKEPGSKVFIPLAEEYGKAGMWEEAVAVLEDGLKNYPGFITAMVALGRAYEQMNQPIKAKALLEEAIKLSPDNLRAHRTLAKLYAAEGAKEAAIRSCAVILSVNPHDQEALALRAGLDVQATSDAMQSPGQESEKQIKTAGPDLYRNKGLIQAVDDATVATKDDADGFPMGGLHSAKELSPTADSKFQVAKKPRNPVIVQLEQWLVLVQTRRRTPHATF